MIYYIQIDETLSKKKLCYASQIKSNPTRERKERRKMEKIKENALIDFKKMILQSWTYEKLTTEERDQLFKVFEDVRTSEALKGTYYQRWDILHAIYNAFLLGVGYDSFDWRS